VRQGLREARRPAQQVIAVGAAAMQQADERIRRAAGRRP